MAELGTMRLRDMRLSRADKDEVEEHALERPDFPYGLRLSLDDESLEKLGISLPEVGEEFVVVGIGTVTSVSDHQTNGHRHRHVEVQLEKLAFESREETVNVRAEG